MVLNQYLLVAGLIAAGVVIAAVSIHYEGMHFFTEWISRSRLKPRFRVVLAIYGLLFLHVTEIWLFGIGYWWMDARNTAYGSLVGTTPLESIFDYVYFSATVYSTLGFGDLVPQGPMRVLAGIESVTGLVLITWSASFTYLEMIQYWRRKA